jgi:hypothetical protein
MHNISALARRVQAARHRHKAKKPDFTPVPILLYDPDGEREATWLNGPIPDNFEGTVFYLPYNNRDD